jgi:hypothetical protein
MTLPNCVLPAVARCPHAATEPAAPLDDVVVIIPARNEEASIGFVLGDLPPLGGVIVVNNGSDDGTAAVARSHGAHVVDEIERGYGAACLAGLVELDRSISAGILREPKIVAFLDADYSDHPELLSQLAAPLLNGEADFVLGSRLLGQRESGAMTPQSVFGNRLACFLMRRVWGTHYTDLGPFRLIRYDRLRALGMKDRNFGWTIEMQIKAAVAGLRILEIPVPYRRRIGKSKISGTVLGSVKAGAKILYTIAKYARQTVRLEPTSHYNRRAI